MEWMHVCVCIILHNDQVSFAHAKLINFSGRFLNRIIIVSEYARTITVFFKFDLDSLTAYGK